MIYLSIFNLYKKKSADGRGESRYKLRGPAIRKRARGPNMLQTFSFFLCSIYGIYSLLADCTNKDFQTSPSPSATDSRFFRFIAKIVLPVYPRWGARKIILPGPEPLSTALTATGTIKVLGKTMVLIPYALVNKSSTMDNRTVRFLDKILCSLLMIDTYLP